MIPQENLIDQLETAMSGKSLGRRADILKRITDLFLSGSGKFSEDQIDLFDEVMTRLLNGVEAAARARFGNRLADATDAPTNVVRRLAFDDSIEVAGPILARSDRIDEQDLVRNAETMSQQHLLAISKRRELKERLTDVLVERGNCEVLISTATNLGSRFSPLGISTLVNKAGSNEELALTIWSRPDIPRQEMVMLLRQASEGLRLQLEGTNPRHVQSIRNAVSAASERILAIARAKSASFRDASILVPELHSNGQLDETALSELLAQGDFDGIAIALSLMCDLPVGLIERTLAQGRFEQMLLFTKSVELSWNTTLALIQFQAGRNALSQAELDRYFATYSRMQLKTARTALQFYRLRESSMKTDVPFG